MINKKQITDSGAIRRTFIHTSRWHALTFFSSTKPERDPWRDIEFSPMVAFSLRPEVQFDLFLPWINIEVGLRLYLLKEER